MKNERQSKILELISTNTVETQEELMRLLSENNFRVTQATVSRDIRELNLIKRVGKDGRSSYSAASAKEPEAASKFYSLFGDFANSVDYGGNTVCISCSGGMAQAICASMDKLEFDGVIGTLAGEDTIFVLCKTIDAAAKLSANLNSLIRR
ncbi:MAG: arginine repressor [Oscillospiraceae bacterium]|jgi:transcriptional regulator of arginine metabolism|nr:arginine repressor [Oscillospiraceae bacterium]